MLGEKTGLCDLLHTAIRSFCWSKMHWTLIQSLSPWNKPCQSCKIKKHLVAFLAMQLRFLIYNMNYTVNVSFYIPVPLMTYMYTWRLAGCGTKGSPCLTGNFGDGCTFSVQVVLKYFTKNIRLFHLVAGSFDNECGLCVNKEFFSINLSWNLSTKSRWWGQYLHHTKQTVKLAVLTDLFSLPVHS